jgi:hypothetical protein
VGPSPSPNGLVAGRVRLGLPLDGEGRLAGEQLLVASGQEPAGTPGSGGHAVRGVKLALEFARVAGDWAVYVLAESLSCRSDRGPLGRPGCGYRHARPIRCLQFDSPSIAGVVLSLYRCRSIMALHSLQCYNLL